MNQATKETGAGASAQKNAPSGEIRYEIFSNVASSDFGLKDNPICQDLVDSLSMAGITARFIRQIAREEGEINVASQKTAKGLNVKQKSIKNLQPQTTLMGVLNWVRAASVRPDRGLHLEVENVRGTNGTPLILGQLYHRECKAFLSGGEEGNWERLIAKIDFTLKEIPSELKTAKDARAEYCARGGRATSFLTTLQSLNQLMFLPKDFRAKTANMIKMRDKDAVGRMSEAEFVNLGLISDMVERYERLLDQFYGLLEQGDINTDLPAAFSLMTQGISFEKLRQHLMQFLIEARQGSAEDPRALAHSLRISLNRSDETVRAKFRQVFNSLFFATRGRVDPDLYGKMMRLEPVAMADEEVIENNRKFFRSIDAMVKAIKLKDLPPDDTVAPRLLETVFEMVVSLNYQGEYNNPRITEHNVPTKAKVARLLLGCVAFQNLELKSLRNLNKKIPPRGVAKDLVRKTKVTNREIVQVTDNLRQALFPYLKQANTVANIVVTRFANLEANRRKAQIHHYLNSALPLIQQSNYLIASEGVDALMRGCAAEAGKMIGLSVLVSRDQVRNQAVLDQLRESKTDAVEGYVMLLHGERKTLYPLRTDGQLLGKAYRQLFSDRVINLVRRFLINRSNHLYQTYGNRLFEVIYQHLVWEHGLSLSRYQAGMILYRNKALDRQRLKDFGFIAGGLENGGEGDNPWLHLKDEKEGEQKPSDRFDPAKVTEKYVSLRKEFMAFLEKAKGIANTGPAGEGKPLGEVLAEFSLQGEAGWINPEFKEALAGTDAANELWKVIQGIVVANFQDLVGTGEEGEKSTEAVEFVLPGNTAILAQLKNSHQFTISGEQALFRLRGAAGVSPDKLDGPSKLLSEKLNELLGKPGAITTAIQLLTTFNKYWTQLVEVNGMALLDEVLRETLYKLMRPMPPSPAALRNMPPEMVLCLGPSSADQAKFSKLVPRIDRGEAYATLSQMANWLMRFPKMRQELEEYRDIIADILGLIARFNVSTFDAPYLSQYSVKLRKLDEMLSLPPEYMTLKSLAEIEEHAREMANSITDIFDKESNLGLRDRWFSRLTISLKNRRPDADLFFINKLHDRISETAGQAREGEGSMENARKRSDEQSQTFSERIRNVIESSEKLRKKEVFVVAPTGTQGQLALSLIDQLFRVKGLFVPILADISNAENLNDELLQRLPPHRLFNLAKL